MAAKEEITDTTPDADKAADTPPEPKAPDDEPWTEEDFGILTEEERAALALDDDGRGEDDAAEGESDDADETEAAQVAEEEAGEEEPQSEPAEATADDARTPPPVDLKSYDDQLEKARQDKEDLWTKYQDGEIGDDEYREQVGQIEETERQAVAERAVAEENARRALEGWKKSVTGYAKEVPQLFEEAHLDRWDYHVRAVTRDPAYDDLTDRQKLMLAHANYANEARVRGLDVPPVPGQEAPTPEAAAQSRPEADERPDGVPETPTPTAPKREAPKTLRTMPASDIPAPAESRFAHLDALMGDPDRFEAALAQLSDEDREIYASMTG